MSTIDAIRVRATAQPASTGLRIAGLVVPYLLAAYIAYILLWYLPFKFYPDSELFQTLQDAWGARVRALFPLLHRRGRGGGSPVAAHSRAAGRRCRGGLRHHGRRDLLPCLHALGIDPYHDGGTLLRKPARISCSVLRSW